jgi:hypothetical protein
MIKDVIMREMGQKGGVGRLRREVFRGSFDKLDYHVEEGRQGQSTTAVKMACGESCRQHSPTRALTGDRRQRVQEVACRARQNSRKKAFGIVFILHQPVCVWGGVLI